MTARKGREETHILDDSAGYGGEAALRAEVKVPSDGIDNEKLGQMFYFMNDEVNKLEDAP